MSWGPVEEVRKRTFGGERVERETHMSPTVASEPVRYLSNSS